MELSGPMKTAAARTRGGNVLTVAMLTLALGAPTVGLVFLAYITIAVAAQNSPAPFTAWHGFEVLLFRIVNFLAYDLTIAFLTAILSYLFAGPSGLINGLLFALADRAAPPRVSRPSLGALRGSLAAGPLVIYAFYKQLPDYSLIKQAPFALPGAALSIFPGAISGWVCAPACRRLGWTR